MGTSEPVVVDNVATVTSASTDANPGNNSSTATITVHPGSATATVTSNGRAVATRVSFRAVSSMPGRGRMTVRRDGRVLARGEVRLRAGGSTAVRLTLTRAGRHLLAGAGHVDVRVSLDPDRGPVSVRTVIVSG
jgi:hypothetical protein